MSSLPPDIVTGILIRLPVKSILRFRSVSKAWCSLIDSKDFINLHLSHSITTGSNHSVITENKGTLYSLDSDSLKNLIKIETPLINPLETNVFGTCNGLLLLDNQSHSQSLILYNPSTRKHLHLPPPPRNNNYGDLIPYNDSNCLGYDVVNDDYKVFNFLVFFGKTTPQLIACQLRVYSLKSNLWHIVKDFTKEMKMFSCAEKAYVNGALHTINNKDSTIVALDVCKETLNLMPMPNIKDKNVSHFTPHVFDGCLAILCRYANDRTDIWVMKEYRVKESWSMFLSVKPKISDLLVIPMVYSKSRTEVLLSYNYFHQLEWYDLTKKTVRGFEVSGLPLGFGHVCVESLVSVGGTG